MFDAVLGRGVGARGRPGVGAAVSLSLHALVFAVALLTVAPHPPPPLLEPIHFPFSARAGPALHAASVALAAARPHRPELVKARRAVVAAPSLPRAQASASTVEPGLLPGPVGAGPPEQACSTGACMQAGPGPSATILVLGPEMSPPRLVSSPEARYPAPALLQELQGTVVVRCAVTDRGTVEACRVLKSVPLLDEAALASVIARRYAPALYEGRPVSVWMTLPVRFVLP